MAIVKIEEVFIYVSVSSVDDPVENAKALAAIDHSGIPFGKLIYSDPEQRQMIFDSVNSWWCRDPYNLEPVNSFPFITYTEVHDDIPARSSPVKYKLGHKGVLEFIDFYNSVMKK